MKDLLRREGTAALAGVAARFGVSWERLGEKLGRDVLLAQARALSNTPVETAERSLDIVFMTVMSGHENVTVDVALAVGLRARGHRVKFVVCDQALPACELKKPGQEETWARTCAKCYGFGKRFLSALGFEMISISDLARGSRSDEDWKEAVDSALLKHYKIGILTGGPEETQRRALFEEAARRAAAAARGVRALRPDRIVMSHGIYCTWGPPLEIFREAGIPTVLYAKGTRRDRQIFNWNISTDWWDVDREWERVRDIPLTAAQEAAIDEYIESRRSHARDRIKYHGTTKDSPDALRQELGLKQDRPVFALFTNVLWDAASAQRELAFENPVDWVLRTMDWFATHPDKQLVVRVHPAEAVMGTNQSFLDLIGSAFPELPDNVRVVSPTDEVNSVALVRLADVGLVHTSTVGIELALEGKPSVIVSRTYYRKKGFTIDVENEAEYLRLLEGCDLSGFDPERTRVLAKRFAYLIFERYQIPFPYLHEPRFGDVRALRWDEPSDLFEEGSMDIVVDAIEREGEFLLPNEAGASQLRER